MSTGLFAKRILELGMPSKFVVRGNSRASPGIALTFDDGPHPENTPRILDCLDSVGVKATFFVQGALAESYPDIVIDAAMRGHKVGNHGYFHRSARSVSSKEYLMDVIRCQKLLQQMLGARATMDFRPPFGHVTFQTLWAMAQSGFRTVFWSIDSRDSFTKNSAELVQHIAQMPFGSREIMLFHDDYSHTTEAMPAVIAHLKALGHQITDWSNCA